MLTVIIATQENEAPKLARTLNALVSFAVDGFIQEVIVLHGALDDDARKLADETGCNLRSVDAGTQDICINARGNWLLFIEAGAKLNAGWAGTVSDHAEAGGGAACFRIARPTGLPWWKRMFAPHKTPNRPLAKGLLISKSQARANSAGKASPEDLMRGLSIKQLAAEISNG